ncbi:TPA: hypothetical protein DDZ10_01795 [Candidatus Uhrbacteria bacterium]|nr:hypothetical protein [Candidatus Uhrbacteria bacterium]
MSLVSASEADPEPFTIVVGGVELHVARELNPRAQRRHRALLLADGTVAHVPTEDAEKKSFSRIMLMFVVISSLRPPTFPEFLDLIKTKKGTVVGFRREFIPLHAWDWREIFPCLTLEGWLRAGIILALGLHDLHRHGWVNCDVKPQNVCFRETPRGPHPVLFDFDIATPIGQVCAGRVPGRVQGTPAYMAPEQTKEHVVSPATDEWSLALTLLSILLGIEGMAMTGETASRVMKRASRGVFPHWTLVRLALPEELIAVFQKAMAPNPKNRHSSCYQFAHELMRALHSLPEEQRAALLPNPIGVEDTSSASRAGDEDSRGPSAENRPPSRDDTHDPPLFV